MIALPSIAFGGFSGSAKGVTARFQDGRSILSLKAYPTGYATASQLVRRSALSKISKAYKNLTAEQQKTWENLAETVSGKSVFGQKAKLSGSNLFVKLNSNRAYVGEAQLLSSAPANLVAIPTVEFTDYCISENIILFTGVPDPEAELLLVAKMSNGQSRGVSNGWDKTVIISPDKVPDWGDIDLTEAFQNVMGTSPVNGQKYFVEMYWIDPATGFTGVPVKVSRICQDGSAHTGRAMAKRTTFKNSDIVDDESWMTRTSLSQIWMWSLRRAPLSSRRISSMTPPSTMCRRPFATLPRRLTTVPARNSPASCWAVPMAMEVICLISSICTPMIGEASIVSCAQSAVVCGARLVRCSAPV